MKLNINYYKQSSLRLIGIAMGVTGVLIFGFAPAEAGSYYNQPAGGGYGTAPQGAAPGMTIGPRDTITTDSGRTYTSPYYVPATPPKVVTPRQVWRQTSQRMHVFFGDVWNTLRPNGRLASRLPANAQRPVTQNYTVAYRGAGDPPPSTPATAPPRPAPTQVLRNGPPPKSSSHSTPPTDPAPVSVPSQGSTTVREIPSNEPAYPSSPRVNAKAGANTGSSGSRPPAGGSPSGAALPPPDVPPLPLVQLDANPATPKPPEPSIGAPIPPGGDPGSTSLPVPPPPKETPPPETKGTAATSTPPTETPGDSASEPAPEPAPYASPTTTPNHVISPYPPYQELDVGGIGSGGRAIDPVSGKVFRVP